MSVTHTLPPFTTLVARYSAQGRTVCNHVCHTLAESNLEAQALSAMTFRRHATVGKTELNQLIEFRKGLGKTGPSPSQNTSSSWLAMRSPTAVWEPTPAVSSFTQLHSGARASSSLSSSPTDSISSMSSNGSRG